MKQVAYFQHLFEYHSWANGLVMDAAGHMSDEQLRQAQGHSWGSVHGILLHMLSAEWIWLERLKGNSPKAFLPEEEYQTLDAIQDRWARQTADLREFIGAQTEASLEREVATTLSRGQSFHPSVWQILTHMFNHANHHRGELAVMFALMQVPHQEDEFLLYEIARVG